MKELLLALMLDAAEKGKISEENFEEMKADTLKLVSHCNPVVSDLKLKIENATNLIRDIEQIEKNTNDATSIKELIENVVNFNNAFEKFDKAERSRELKFACEIERLDM